MGTFVPWFVVFVFLWVCRLGESALPNLVGWEEWAFAGEAEGEVGLVSWPEGSIVDLGGETIDVVMEEGERESEGAHDVSVSSESCPARVPLWSCFLF